ncbi:hypothetical protein DFH07DRAFT_183597 [Mycena maculata]|uniref:Ams2/SPT21 N-terminal domain-containing protein n=1 Tax=Mycena maculata TaxID=230809 RepID=A0AAD7HXK2_9AGAR|nr:hypothetical protein DFH07DRAFT_183597 [Mycena maculata]
MSDSGSLPLRILYSLNGSSQYILARSQGVVPVQFIPSEGNDTCSSRSTAQLLPRYASAALKTCLDTICRSSPEIIQDRSRDYSVYLLDPLETDCAPAQVNLSQSASHPSVTDAPETRVAVGLGLMSWGMADDATSATGTLKVSAAGQEMLEIIFSLRETLPMQKASLPEAVLSWGLPASSYKQKGKRPAAYPPPRRKPRIVPPKPPRPNPGAIAFEADKLLAVCNSYIGPERRPAGRPLKEWPAIRPDDDDDVVVVAHRPSTASSSHPDQPNDQPTQNPSPFLDFIAFLNAIGPDMERNKALGNVLGLVHGPDGTAVQPPPELVDAMTLFSELQRAPHFPHQSQSDPAPPSDNQHRRKISSTDDEIVVLNKENVNPTIFRRRAERERQDAKLLGSIEPPGTIPPSPQPEPTTLMPSNQPPTKKRTLSEFMEEQESRREQEKVQKRGQYYRQPELRHPLPKDGFMHHPVPETTTPAITAVSTNNRNDSPKAKSSRTRSRRTISWTSYPGPNVVKEAAVPPPIPTASASSPVRPPRKKYIIPEWARTGTATQPRLSDTVMQRVQLKEQEEAERRKEARRKKDKEEKERLLRDGMRCKPGRGPSAAASEGPSPGTAPGVKVPPPLPAPVAANGEFPVFNSSVAPPSSPSRVASSNNHPPCTPPRKRRANTIATPGGSNSLFTPASGSWETSGVLNSGRRSMSPSSRKASTQDEPPTQPGKEPESEDEDLLGQELDSAFDELDFPPSSAPVASSDIERDVEMPKSSLEYDSDDSDDADGPPKQHWVGLPPSSPPPPSSPFLNGSSPMDDDDVDELPLTTTDADVGSELEPLNSPDTGVTSYSVEELGKLLNIDDLSNFFPSPPVENIDAASLFDQLTNNLELSCDESSQTMKDWGLDMNLDANPDFDFTEFWESVKPLVEGTSHLDTNPDFGQSNTDEPVAIDNARLADDVHALFSGCLV